MHRFAVIVLVCCSAAPLAWPAGAPLIKLEIYSGVHLEVPGDWLVQENKSVIGAVSDLARKGGAPAAPNLSRTLYPPPLAGPAVMDLRVALLPEAEAAATRHDFEPSQIQITSQKLAQVAQESARITILGASFTPKGRATVTATTISGIPALTSHVVGQSPGISDITFDGVFLCAGNALISITAMKRGDAPDESAALDRVRASLSLDATVPKIRKPWESAPPSAPAATAPDAAQKKADGTVWNLFSGLGKKQPPGSAPARAAQDGLAGHWLTDIEQDLGGGKTEMRPTLWQIGDAALTIWNARVVKGVIAANGGTWAIRSPGQPGDLDHGTYREGVNDDDLITRIAGLPPEDIVWTLVGDKPSRMPRCLASRASLPFTDRGPRDAFDALVLGFWEAAYTLNGQRHETLWRVMADGQTLRLDATLNPMTLIKQDDSHLKITSPEGDTLIFDFRLIDKDTLQIGLGGETMRFKRMQE